MRTMRTATGLDVRLYPNVIEYWHRDRHLLSLAPSEYGEIHRWIGGELQAIAEDLAPVMALAAPDREEPV